MTYFRPNIDAMCGYTPGEQPKAGTRLIKLNTNENPYPPSPAVVQALTQFPFADLRKYPPPAAAPLLAAASALYGCAEDQIIAGNGSDEVLAMITRAFLSPGDRVGWFDPSYSLYPVLAEIQDARPVVVALQGASFAFPDDAEAQAKGCRLFFVTRPNAPTGHCYGRARLAAFCAAFQGIVVIDEAYADFAQDNCLDFVARFPNVIVTRTFSKSYSLAGLRVGLAFAQPELIRGLMKVKDSYNLNFLAQYAAAAALRDQDYLRSNVAKILATRSAAISALQQRGFAVFLPSESNFLLAEPPATHSAAALTQSLRELGYLIRFFKIPGVERFIRVSIGSDEEMEGFFAALDQILCRSAGPR